MTTKHDNITAKITTAFNNLMNTQYVNTHTVISSTGYWLLLALLAPEMDTHRTEIEALLGTDAADARRRAEKLLSETHPAVAVAVATWARTQLTNSTYDNLVQTLNHVDSGPMPTQTEADTWASQHTHGQISAFPLQIDDLTAAIIASAVATDTTWAVPFNTVDATNLGGWFGPEHPTALRAPTGHHCGVVTTTTAGKVGAHLAESTNGLAILSVIAGENIAAADVHAAAAEIAATISNGRITEHVTDLFDLPLGDGAAWTLTEDKTLSRERRPIQETDALLPEWQAEKIHDLTTAPGMAGVRAALSRFLNTAYSPPDFEAKQAVTAEYTKTGFKAAAISAISLRAAGIPPPPVEVTRRTATIRYNRPYAVLAIAQNSAPDLNRGWGRIEDLGAGAWDGVPVFSAWVGKPA